MGMQLPKKGNKYRNIRTTVGEMSFASKKEAKRYGELLILQKMGLISELRTQVWFKLIVNGVKVCIYVADMTYTENGKEVVEDVKSAFTRKNSVYIIKRALMKACLNITIRET